MEKNRYPFFDNAKYLLIILVVIGHAIEPFIKNDLALMVLYKTIYLFHMPAFALISGFLAKNYNPTTDLGKIAKKTLIPYLVIESLIDILNTYPTIRLTPLTPSWGMWFLLSYFCWYFLLPYYKKLKNPIFTSLIIGLLVGYFNDIGPFMSISRTLVFMPFFLFGYLTKREILEKNISSWKIIFTVSCILLFIMNMKISYNYAFLHQSLSYYSFNILTHGWLWRSILYLAATFFTILFLRSISSNTLFYTKWGGNTLYAYLSQIIFFTTLEKIKFYTYIDTTYEKIALILAAILITTLFSTNTFKEMLLKIFAVVSKFTTNITRKIIDEINKKIILIKQ